MILKTQSNLLYDYISSTSDIIYKSAKVVFLIFVFMAFLYGCSEGESTQQTARPYSDVENIDVNIQKALKDIGNNRKLMLIFGANWCPTCRRIDASLKQPEISGYLKNNFIILKVNVGDYDKNQDIVKRYKTTLKGIPSMVILNNKERVLKRIDPFKLSTTHKKGRSKFFMWIKSL